MHGNSGNAGATKEVEERLFFRHITSKKVISKILSLVSFFNQLNLGLGPVPGHGPFGTGPQR